LILLYPGIPLLFMGEESAADAPFPFFVDFEDQQLRQAVAAGRAREYPQQAALGMLSPIDSDAFLRAKCDDPRGHDADMLAWYRRLIALRKQGIAAGWLAAERMVTACDPQQSLFALRYARPQGGQVVVQSRLAADRRAAPLQLPLEGEILLSSEPVTTAGDGGIAMGPCHTIILNEPP
jgi:1,4-alpha-glucan branching enzyme